MKQFLGRSVVRARLSSLCVQSTWKYKPAVIPLIRTLHGGQVKLNELNKANKDFLSKNTDYLHIQNILLRKNQERLNKKRMLSEATNFYERFKVNTKWFLIRNNRPFSANEISTMFSWLLISQIAWIILGTTTFVSILLLIFNTVFAKEMVGKCIGKLLNAFLDDIDIKFEDALVPKWKKGCIRFNKVELRTTEKNQDVLEGVESGEEPNLQFQLRFHQIELTLSLKKWLFGQGAIKDISVYGMRGDISINYAYEQSPEKMFLDWFSNKDYQLGKVQLTDSCVNVYDKQLNHKYRVSVYNLCMPQLRFQWMLPDFFNADVATGAINHALFTIHKRQHKLVYLNEMEKDLSPWKRITRLRLDAIDVKDLGLNKSNTFNWFEDGELEITADIMLPHEDAGTENDGDKNKYMVFDLRFKFKNARARIPDVAPRLSSGEEIISLDELKPLISFINTQNGYCRSMASIENTNAVWNSSNVSISKNRSYPNVTVIPSPVQWAHDEDEVESKGQEIIRFHDQPQHNSNELVLRCRIVKNIQDLKDKVMFQETGIYDTLSMELYVDLIRMVEEWEYNKKNDWMKLWGTTVASQLLIFGLGAMV